MVRKRRVSSSGRGMCALAAQNKTKKQREDTRVQNVDHCYTVTNDNLTGYVLMALAILL